MKRRIQKTFIDYGCGFPVVLENVSMVFIRGVWTPDINYNDLHKGVFYALSKKEILTDEEIKFMRDYDANLSSSEGI